MHMKPCGVEGGSIRSCQLKMTDEDKTHWDAGLNKGLIYRPEAQRTKEDERTNTPAKPAYYAESGAPIPYIKAIIYAGIAILPYFTILDQLGATVDFVPCNGMTCHYMRIFNSEHIPATGINVIGVQNGVERPMAMHYLDFDAYACQRNDKNRTYLTKIWGPEASICPPMDKQKYTVFLDEHNLESTKDKVNEESFFAINNFTSSVKLGFLITKLPFWAFAWPINAAAKLNPRWGMEHIPSARCPNHSKKEMEKVCWDINHKNRRLKKSEHHLISNHLKVWGPAKVGTVVGLVLYAIFTVLHDVGLLAGASEITTLTLGFCGCVSWGFGAIAIFFWAMGASEVFVAPIRGQDVNSCACYYQMPEMKALIGLTTPFAMMVGFMTKAQMQGLAALFGDYLSFQTYFIPHYLGKQSFLWTWAVLTTPKMAGTIVGDPRHKFTPAQWAMLRRQQTCLYWLSVLLRLVVALSASSFMIAFKELCISLYMKNDMTLMMDIFVKWILLCGPSVFAAIVGIMAVKDLSQLTIYPEEGESFLGQVRNVCPCFAKLEGLKEKYPWLKANEHRLAHLSFWPGALAITLWTAAVAQGLCPDRSFLFGSESLTHPKLAQAELWGSAGFVFFIVHVPTVLSVAFSSWDDMESMKYLEDQRSELQQSPTYMALDKAAEANRAAGGSAETLLKVEEGTTSS